jgi:hypothetical protein
MTPADFMSRVVVWPGDDNAPGWINLHWQVPPEKGTGLRGRPFKHLHEFMSFVQFASTKPGHFKEMYFCLSTQQDRGKQLANRWTAHRHSSKALGFKAIWIDADVKPGGYATLAEAIAAVNDFRLKAGLPPPTAIIVTGGGIHVYWISLKPLTPDEWRPYAEGLKAEAIRLGLKCDAGVTADAARIMRVPGTFNNKTGTPRPVKLVHLGDSYDFAGAAFVALAAKAPPPPAATKAPVTAPVTVFQLPPEFANGVSKLFAHLDPRTDNIGAGIGRNDPDLPLDKAEIFKGCFHFQDSYRTHGKGQSQGLWHLNALACTWLEGGREIYHKLANGYPTYTPEESDRMFDRKLKDRAEFNLGWPSCKTFEGEGAKCSSCPYYNRLRSPLNLAERVRPIAPAQILPPLDDVPVDLPEDYTINGKGYICEIVKKEDRNGNESTHYEPLFWCKLKDFQAQSGKRMLTFMTSLDMGKWDKAEISETDDLINDTTILKALRKHGVKPNTKIAPKRIITFVTSFMAKLDENRARQQTLPFGWLREEEGGAMPVGFAYGGRVVMTTGKPRPAGYSDKQLEAFYSPKGKEDAWFELLHVITAQHHPALECIVATSFAAPLSFATGQYNGVINAWSPESGAHKTTSMHLGAALWGTPKLTKEKPDSSRKGIIHKMGLIKNLPVYWDEIDSFEKMKQVIDILSSTEGSGGSKLTSGRDLHIYDEWQTLMQVASNRSMVEQIVEANTGTDAKLQRVFEYQVEKRDDTHHHYDIDGLTNALDYNYGHVGVRYSALLGRDVVRIHGLVKAALKRFSKEVNVKSEERFRCAIASTIFVGAMLGNEIGCNFNLKEIWAFMKSEFIRQRNRMMNADVVAGSGNNSQNWFTQFLKTYGDNALWINSMPARKPGHPPAIVWVAGVNALRPRPIHIRLSVSDGLIDVSRTKFFDWLVLREATPSSVLSGLVRHFGATEPGRFNLAAGAGVLGGGREPVIRIPVPGPDSPWWNDLHAHTPPDQRIVTQTPVTATVIPIDRSVS